MRAAARTLTVAWLPLVLAGCARDEAWNVLLVTFDTTRADRIGAYGYPEPTTPNVDRLASEGVLFTRSFATNPVTLPSHGSILTGTYPPTHGIRDNGVYVLPEEATTLAEILRQEGYATAAIVSSFVLDSRFNVDQGFDVFDDRVEAHWSRDELAARAANAFGFAERKANLVTLAAREWWETRPRRPFFLWLHYFDPHEPRNPPEPHHSRFHDPYDGELAFADEQLGGVLEMLRRGGEYDRTLIVFTADHGEGLLDHGEPTHSLLLFDTTLRVPLIVRVPGRSGGERSDALASGVDILPSILALLGIDVPDHVQGRPLLGPAGAAPPAGDRFVYGESFVGRIQHGWGALRTLRDGRYKLHFGPIPRLYDVAADPEETFDLAAERPQTVAAMKGQMERLLDVWSAGAGGGSTTTMSGDEIRKLRALGYTSAGSAPARVSEDLDAVEGQADPYAMRYLFDLFGVASENVRTGNHLQGIRQLEEFVAVDPRSPMALTTLGTAYFLHAGQPLRAQELFERSLALDPRQESARYFLARIHIALGDLPAARAECERILEFMPESVSALYELARILEAEGDLPGARRHFELALERDPSNVPVLISFGAHLARRQEREPAGRHLLRALELDPGNPEALYNLGIWHLQGGDRERAVLYLEQAQRANAEDRDAPFVLGRLYLEQGRHDLARQSLERARRLAPTAARRAEIERLLQGLAPGSRVDGEP